MAFSRDIAESYRRLKIALGDLLEGQRPELTISRGGDYPLLVLETSCDSVGFAVLNGKPESSFDSAYDSFKHLYRQNHSAWKERNISFVVCRPEHEYIHDAFFSTIETDVYFCKKYVVCIRRNKDELARELLRLPFLPLPEDHTGGILRPPAAQTLLQSLNVSAQLARQIIVPLEYSANRIVDQLLKEKEAFLTLGTSAGPDLQHHPQPKERMRIKSVEFEAFRAYKKRQEFDVDADVVVFYGPNGLGKTSFFDGLDYVCTGRIGRLCRHRIRQNEFMDLARHLGSSVSEGYVSMVVSQGAKDCLVKRSVADWSTALIGNDKYDRASALQFLTTSQLESKKLRIENLERLFRATHLFGQSDPELLVEFEKDSTLSSDLVHRMLALDDYASGLTKAAAILAELDKRIADNKKRISALKINANDVQTQIKALPEPHDTVEAGKQLRDMAMSLVTDLQVHLNVTLADSEPSQTSTREWRAITESALKDAEDRHRQLQFIESSFAQYDQNRSSLNNITDELSELEVVLKEKTIDHRLQQGERKKYIGRLEEERATLAQANARLKALTELGSLQEVFQKNNRSLQQWQIELKRVSGKADAITAELQPQIAVVVVERLHNQAAELREAFQTKSQQIHILTGIQNNFPTWEKNRANIIILQQSYDGMQSAIQSAESSIDEFKNGITAREKDLSSCEQEYRDLTVHQQELTRLLDEIEAHVENGICPTCGIDHKSKTVLVERIRSQKQARPSQVDVLAKRCGDLRKTLSQDKALLATRISELAFKKAELEEMASKLVGVRESASEFERTVFEAGLQVVDKQLSAAVARKLSEVKAEQQSLQETLTNLESELSITTKRINDLEKEQAQLKESRKRADAAILQLEQQISTLRAKAEVPGLALEMTPEEFATESAVATSLKSKAEERIRELTLHAEKITQSVKAVERQISEVTDKIDFLRQNKARLEETQQRYVESAASVVDRNALSLDAISEQRRQATERVDNLDALRRRCTTLEQAMDSTRRSALLAELEAKARSLSTIRQTMDDSAVRMTDVRKWFVSVKDALDSQSSSAVANHVDAFGPLTSLIQKRLRAVYGFGDVTLLARGNEIRVVVDWETKHVKPADYFSDSQKQILMLSLFLSGRLTQTWSGFAPILMDDPVTHFDDLNAFGFVELIRGLVSSSPGKRQFFISTCEDRLFELMIKKFNNVEGGAKFYKFEGIGRDGPIVRQA